MKMKLQSIVHRVACVLLLSICLGISALNAAVRYAITPTSIYPEAYSGLSALLPSDFWNTTYKNGVAVFDRLFISLQFDAVTAQALGFSANIPYVFVFDCNSNGQFDATAGREQWYCYVNSFEVNVSNTIYSSGYWADGKSCYYSAGNYPAGMAVFGLPYIAPTGVKPDGAVEQLLAPKLPQDYLTDLFAGQKGTMDYLYAAMRFSETEVSELSAMGFSFPVDEDMMFTFSKVVCSDGNDYYVPVDFRQVSASNFVLKNLNGKKLYFTGSVQNAFAGNGAASEGFFYLQGTDDESVDVYLHDYKVLSVQPKNLGDLNFNGFMESTSTGMAAPFAIGSSGEQTNGSIFTVNFHIKGDNCLTGGAESAYSSTDAVMNILAEIISMHAAPITVRPIGDIADVENKSCSLNFDDRFPAASGTVATNGLLALPVVEHRDAPSIDLGNRFGRCTFDGGQYRLTTAGNSSMFYVTSMAICYRLLEMGKSSDSDRPMRKYGVGTSMATPDKYSGAWFTVHIKDGTFTTYSAEEFRDVVDVVAHGWYRDYTDLRLPIKTRIDGGTFNNCNVYACDASAEQGNLPVNTAKEVLCRTETEVAAPDADGLASLDLSASYPAYGTASLTPVKSEDKYYVYPYLPTGDCGKQTNSYTHNYVSVIPLMGVNGLLTMGGDVEVFATESDGTPRKNAFFFYTRLNDYTKKYASVTLAGLPVRVEQAISFAADTLTGEHEFSEVTNNDDYKIAHGLYTMLSFNSNQWYTICPPYDVHNVYVVETLPDDSLAAKGLTQADKGTEKYLRTQGEADGVLAQGIVTSLLPDILSGKGSGVYMDLLDICRKTLHLNPTLLTHYNPSLAGHDLSHANYYLYQQVEEQDADELENPGMWNVEHNINDYSSKWQYAVPAETEDTYIDKDGNIRPNTEVLMQRGKNYSLFLPAGKDDYWTGKYLIFEGYGPQKLNGKNAMMGYVTSAEGSGGYIFDYMDATDPDRVVYLLGNSTFANDTTSDETGRVFIPDTKSKTHDFVRQELGHIIMPWETMLVMSSANTDAYASLSDLSTSVLRSMQAKDTSLPSVMGNTLLAYGREGILLQSLVEQTVSVYSVEGLLLWTGLLGQNRTKHISVPAGVYVVQGTWQTIKLIVTE